MSSNFLSLTSSETEFPSFTAFTIATSLIYSELDYCNSILLNLPSTQIKRLHSATLF
jgi:hypothetical protein